MKPIPLLMFMVFFTLGLTAAPATLLEEGRNAEAAENYQKAIELYRQAMAAAPADPAPARALAELFTQKSLHELALPAWQETVHRAPGDPTAWIALAQAFSYLDQNSRSVQTLREAADRFSGDLEVVQTLAWMLFKTEDFPGGVSLVEDHIARHGTDKALEMTLGTLYSSLDRYDLSRVHYLKSLDLSPGSGGGPRNFRSVVWYNLSLLERNFYQFDLADEAIRKSLEEEDRPSGSLARGELFQDRRDFAEAKRLFQKAADADETPLSRFDLAQLLQKFGYLDEAEAQLTQVERHKDDTWIYNYGVTKDKMLRDIHEVRADLHRSRFHALDFQPRAHVGDWLVWGWNKVREGLAWWYHDQTWKNLLVKVADASRMAGNAPDAWVGLTLAHRDRPALGLKFLAQVRAHDLPNKSRARGSFLVEEGVMGRSAPILLQALGQLQVPWENEDRERALSTLVTLRRDQGRSAEVRSLLDTLYRLNPGCLPIQGWGLPVRLGLFGEESGLRDWKAAWEAYTAQTGWDCSSEDRPGVSWNLDVRVTATGAAWTLRNPEGEVLKSGEARPGTGGRLVAVAGIFRAVHAPVP